jgi:phenylacetate-CoA ligase
VLRLSIECRRGADGTTLCRRIAEEVKARFELLPHVVLLETGTLAKEFEANVKASRFVDRRGK